MARGRAEPFRAPRPRAADRIAWPDAFGTRFAVFVDTEEEFDWAQPLRRDARGTEHIRALVPLHRRFAEAGVPLTYLVDHPVATCRRSTELIGGLLGDGRSAIGAQLHPWVNPPHDEAVSRVNSFAGNLPPGLEAAKLAVLTRAIADGFGRRPIVYRAGRYGIGPRTAAILAGHGYRIDASVRPGYDYSAEGGPDFTAMDSHAFHLPEGLVALPLTTVFTGALRRHGAPLHRALGRLPKGRAIAARLGLLSRVALSPEGMPLPDALEAIRVADGEGVRLLHFSFHSPSAEPGHTPYVRTAADLAAFHRWWGAVFALLARRGIAAASLDEIVDAACGEGGGSAIGAGAGGL